MGPGIARWSIARSWLKRGQPAAEVQWVGGGLCSPPISGIAAVGLVGIGVFISRLQPTLKLKQKLFVVCRDLLLSGEFKQHFTLSISHGRDGDRSRSDEGCDDATEGHAPEQNRECESKRGWSRDLPSSSCEDGAKYEDNPKCSERPSVGYLNIRRHIAERDVPFVWRLRKPPPNNYTVASQHEGIDKQSRSYLAERHVCGTWHYFAQRCYSAALNAAIAGNKMVSFPT